VGDDDVWAFVNGKLAMDLGGIHGSEKGSISLDGVAVKFGLTEGKSYPFDFFYAERHVDSSTIKVTTNLFTPQSYIRLYGKSGTPDINGNVALSSLDTLPAGEKTVIYSHVFDSIQWRPEWDKLITWEISDPGAVKSEPAQNGAISLLASKVYSQITLTAKFISPDDPTHKEITTVIKLIVGPGKPYKITFQKTNEIVQLENNLLTTISIAEQESSALLYAVVRDSMGNFIRFSDKTQWRTSDAAIGTVLPETGKNYKGIITKVKSGRIQVTANESGLKPAVIDVVISTPVVVVPVSHVALTNAITADRDGDGYLDMITLRFDSTLTISNQSAIANMQISSNGIQFKVESISSISGGSTGTEFQLYIHEVTTGGFQTGWKPVITIIANPDMAPIPTFECTDGAGPVIGRARYYPGTLKTEMNSSGTPDTIYITVSEKVKLPSNNDPNGMFAYYQKGAIKTNAFQSIIDFNDSTAKLIVLDGFSIEPISDSLQLISINGVVDQYSNKPDANSRKTTVESADISVVYTPSSNPIVYGRDIKDLNAEFLRLYLKVIESQPDNANVSSILPWVVIRLRVKGTLLKELPDGSFGKAVVYDAVGNLVRSHLKVTKGIGSEYGIYWDGQNANMRNASFGTYLMVVNITDVSGKSRQDRFKIGIKKDM
jgi:fibro-slime domain-containing protein